MTAMEKATNDKDRFTMTELAALRNDLLQGGMIDSYEAAELLQVFLMGRGYGVSPKAALDAAGRVEMAGCALPVLMHELEMFKSCPRMDSLEIAEDIERRLINLPSSARYGVADER